MSLVKLIITLDYELPAHEAADVMRHMVRPTQAVIEACSSLGAKLTIMLEIGEVWAFGRRSNSGFKKYLRYDPVEEIERQLVAAVRRGHDVQLHLHPQWLGAHWVDGRWQLDYSKYRLTSLDSAEIVDVLRRGKQYLESLLRPHSDDYACVGFRAGNWNTQPSSKYLRALHEAGLISDTSVFKGGYVNTASVRFDYRQACSDVLPWVASWEDINTPGSPPGIVELPICAQQVSILGMLSFKRLLKARTCLAEDKLIARAVHAATPSSPPQSGHGITQRVRRLCGTYPKKLDFCKLSPREMIAMIHKIQDRVAAESALPILPVVMIGHSKEIESPDRVRSTFARMCEGLGDAARFVTYREALMEILANADDVLCKRRVS